MKPKATLAHIGALIKAKRRESDLGLRTAASKSGVSASTLSRLERGIATSLPDADTLTRLAAWLNVSIAELLGEQVSEGKKSAPELTTPEFVEVHLRADKHLSSKTADTLAKMFRMLYEQFAETEGGEAIKDRHEVESKP